MPEPELIRGPADLLPHAPQDMGGEDYGSLYGDLYAQFPQEKRSIGSSGLTMLKVDQSSHQTKDPSIEDIVFRLVCGGALSASTVDCGNGRTTLSGRRGSLYLAPADAAADWRSEGAHQLLLLALPRRSAVALLADGDPDSKDPLDALYGREVLDASIAQLMSRIWDEGARDGPGASLLVDGLFMTLLGTLAGLGTGRRERGDESKDSALDDRRLARVIDYVDANLAQAITIEDLAQIACLSQYHFSRCFRLATNASPHAFVVARRIEASRAMLGDRSLSLAEVAYACGFSSQSHFTTQFRAHVGMPPGAYRANLGN